MHNEESRNEEGARGEEPGAEHIKTEDSPPEAVQPDESKPDEAKPDETKPGEADAEGTEAEAPKEQSAIGIRFEPCGKVYFFRANGMGLKRGERVVVESELGVSIGRVVLEDEMRKDTGKELKPVLRRVTEDDLKKEEDNRSLKKEAFDFCNERIMARGLAMKLLGTDVTLDRKRIVFFFSAETRIDFRELVKDLAAKFRTRIELRQVGVRDAARITGGLGVCGRELCCRRFLTSFLPISIKMAKKQDLALNTSKLSGICGRLMCCLGYEYEEKARELKKKKREERPEEKKAEKEEAREATVVETPPEAPKPPEAAPRTEAAPVGEGEAPAKKRRRRRKHRPRRRPGEEGQRGQEQRPAPKEQPAKAKAPEAGAAEAKPSGEKPSGEKPAEGAPSGKKPFRRKRRRRMKGKSSRPAHEKKE